MSTNYFTDNLSMKDLYNKEKTLNDNKITIEEHNYNYWLVDQSCDQQILIDMNSSLDTRIGFTRSYGNSEGCENIIGLIHKLFPDCGLISEHEYYEKERGFHNE